MELNAHVEPSQPMTTATNATPTKAIRTMGNHTSPLTNYEWATALN